jgi:predicted metal-binding membrane protein
MSETSVRIRTVPAPAALLGVAAAWAGLAAGAGHVSHEDVLGSGHTPGVTSLVVLLGGWQLMVVAMMVPPEIAAATGAPSRFAGRGSAVPTALVATMCAVWTGFVIVALAGDAVVHRLVHSWPGLAGLIAPVVLVGAGMFQRSGLRDRLLVRARVPSRPHWPHALCCLGSCWALMLVMFAMGMGSLRWMAALTAVMTVERAAGPGLERLWGQLVGWVLISAGALVAIQPGLLG